jgi:hypothetical protein
VEMHYGGTGVEDAKENKKKYTQNEIILIIIIIMKES